MDPETVEKEEKIFDSQVEESNEKLKATHEKKEYTFSTTEKRRLAQQNLIEKFASQALQDLINLTVLPRVGVIPNNETFTIYSIATGRLCVFIPKVKVEPKVESNNESVKKS